MGLWKGVGDVVSERNAIRSTENGCFVAELHLFEVDESLCLDLRRTMYSRFRFVSPERPVKTCDAQLCKGVGDVAVN